MNAKKLLSIVIMSAMMVYVFVAAAYILNKSIVSDTSNYHIIASFIGGGDVNKASPPTEILSGEVSDAPISDSAQLSATAKDIVSDSVKTVFAATVAVADSSTSSHAMSSISDEEANVINEKINEIQEQIFQLKTEITDPSPTSTGA